MSFDQTWERCLPFLAEAIDSAGTHGPEDVREIVRTSQAHILWPGEKSAMITEFNDYPLVRECFVWFAGGDMDELVGTLLPQVERICEANGVHRIVEAGRTGWGRVLKKHGYEVTSHVCMKRIGE